MTVDVLTETVINRALEGVADYAADPTNAPAWYANISEVRWETEPPLAVGSRLAFVASFLGRRLTYTWTALTGDSTRMTLRNRGEPSGFAGIAAPVMAKAMSRANTKDLALLKKLLEQR